MPVPSPATGRGHAKGVRRLSGRGRHGRVVLRADGEQADCAFASFAQVCRPVTAGKACDVDRQISPNCAKGGPGRIASCGRAEDCQVVAFVAQWRGPQESAMSAKWWDDEGIYPDLCANKVDGDGEEMHQTGCEGGASNCRAEGVWVTQLTEGDPAPGVQSQTFEEQGRVNARAGGPTEKVFVQRRAMEAKMSFIEHRTAEEGLTIHVSRHVVHRGCPEVHSSVSGKGNQPIQKMSRQWHGLREMKGSRRRMGRNVRGVVGSRLRKAQNYGP